MNHCILHNSHLEAGVHKNRKDHENLINKKKKEKLSGLLLRTADYRNDGQGVSSIFEYVAKRLGTIGCTQQLTYLDTKLLLWILNMSEHFFSVMSFAMTTLRKGSLPTNFETQLFRIMNRDY